METITNIHYESKSKFKLCGTFGEMLVSRRALYKAFNEKKVYLKSIISDIQKRLQWDNHFTNTDMEEEMLSIAHEMCGVRLDETNTMEIEMNGNKYNIDVHSFFYSIADDLLT